MLYIHQFPDWTRFRFDSKAIINELGQVRLEEGRLLGISEMLDDDTLEAETIVRDIVATYAIDGQQLNSELVQEQVNKKEKADKAAFRSLVGAVRNFRDEIDEARILGWHASITGKPQRQYRSGPGQVHSRTDNSVVFAGPGPERLQHEMGNFITWLNTAQLDPVLKAAIAQFWFLTIRPFDEANGKIARLITNLLLARAESAGRLQYSINEQVLGDSDSYFRILGAAQCGNGDLTEWKCVRTWSSSRARKVPRVYSPAPRKSWTPSSPEKFRIHSRSRTSPGSPAQATTAPCETSKNSSRKNSSSPARRADGARVTASSSKSSLSYSCR